MKLKQILVLSLVVNFLIVCSAAYFVQKKGLTNVVSKVTEVVSGEQKIGGAYFDRTSLFSTFTDSGGVVFIGDSITYGNEWHEMFPSVDVKNRGISNDDSSGVLKRLDEITEMKPEKVFIMIGINDIGRGVTVQGILENYEKILGRLSGVKVYVQSVLPVNENILHSNRNEEIRKLNESLKQLSARQGATYIDLFSSMIDKEGQLKSELTHDGLHLSGKGYTAWKEQIKVFVINR